MKLREDEEEVKNDSEKPSRNTCDMRKNVLKNVRPSGGEFEKEKENGVTDDGREENVVLKLREKMKNKERRKRKLQRTGRKGKKKG